MWDIGAGCGVGWCLPPSYSLFIVTLCSVNGHGGCGWLAGPRPGWPPSGRCPFTLRSVNGHGGLAPARMAPLLQIPSRLTLTQERLCISFLCQCRSALPSVMVSYLTTVSCDCLRRNNSMIKASASSSLSWRGGSYGLGCWRVFGHRHGGDLVLAYYQHASCSPPAPDCPHHLPASLFLDSPIS